MLLNKSQARRFSKLLSYILRHNPTDYDIKLDSQGWTPVKVLLKNINTRRANKERTPYTVEQLREVVATNDKQRFSFDSTGTKIRANQGHSIDIKIKYDERTPPEFLYHGTVGDFLSGIFSKGLVKGGRTHVHLSADVETAAKVGGRRGKPVILSVRAEDMTRDGFKFYLSPNNVWLAEHVPPEYIEVDGSIDGNNISDYWRTKVKS